MAGALDPVRHVFEEPEFRYLFGREIQRATRNQDFLSFCLVRLEHREAPNARVQQVVGENLAELLRATDVVGRMGEDIALLLLHTPDTDAAPIIERVCGRLDRTAISTGDGASVTVSLRTALTCFPTTATTDTALVAAARGRLLEDQKGEHRASQPPSS